VEKFGKRLGRSGDDHGVKTEKQATQGGYHGAAQQHGIQLHDEHLLGCDFTSQIRKRKFALARKTAEGKRRYQRGIVWDSVAARETYFR
jgi:hypothetical protein